MEKQQITMNKIQNVCRVCLQQHEHYFPLNDKYNNVLLFEHIQALTNIEIKYRDGLSDKICDTCLCQLQTAVDFKEKCIKSDVELKKQTLSLKEEITIKYEIIKKEDTDTNIKNESFNEIEFVDYSDEHTDITTDYTQVTVRKSRAVDLNLECHDCGGKFKSKCKLRVHWKKTHMFDNLICPICKRAFKSYKAYNVHKNNNLKSCAVASNENVIIEGVGRARVFECRQCRYRTKRIKDMSAHIVIHTGERPYQCHLCPNNYTQYSTLQSHWEYTHKKFFVEITCHFCGKYIKGRRRVYRHLKSHTETKISCPVCNKVMGKKNYQSHMKRHSGVKSYTCETCASTFYTSAELCNHRRWVHQKKDRIYQCSHCDYKSSREYLLKRHQSKHTGNNYPCTHCGRFYSSTEKLLLHQKIHYDEKKYPCLQCDKRFFKRDSVRKHMKQKHVIPAVPTPKSLTIEVKKENVIETQIDEVIIEN